jgi:hypothetical protein
MKSNINFCLLLLTSEIQLAALCTPQLAALCAPQLAALCTPHLHLGLFWHHISPSKSDTFNTAPRRKEETFAPFTAIN